MAVVTGKRLWGRRRKDRRRSSMMGIEVRNCDRQRQRVLREIYEDLSLLIMSSSLSMNAPDESVDALELSRSGTWLRVRCETIMSLVRWLLGWNGVTIVPSSNQGKAVSSYCPKSRFSRRVPSWVFSLPLEDRTHFFDLLCTSLEDSDHDHCRTPCPPLPQLILAGWSYHLSETSQLHSFRFQKELEALDLVVHKDTQARDMEYRQVNIHHYSTYENESCYTFDLEGGGVIADAIGRIAIDCTTKNYASERKGSLREM